MQTLTYNNTPCYRKFTIPFSMLKHNSSAAPFAKSRLRRFPPLRILSQDHFFSSSVISVSRITPPRNMAGLQVGKSVPKRKLMHMKTRYVEITILLFQGQRTPVAVINHFPLVGTNYLLPNVSADNRTTDFGNTKSFM